MIRLFLAVLMMGAASGAAAQDQGATQNSVMADQAIADRLTQSAPVTTSRINLFADADIFDPDEAQAFANKLEEGLLAVERLTGAEVDAAHYGDTRVSVFVTGRVTISHVYGGYDHPKYERAFLYLNPRRVEVNAAPYLHELTHIVLRDFGSHSLREGFASYVEGELAGQGIGYNSGVFGPGPRADVDAASAAVLASETGAKVLPWIGGPGATDPAITSAKDPETRSAFYLLSRSFVQYMLDATQLGDFLNLYRAKDTEDAYLRYTGRSRQDWLAAWQASLLRQKR